ncbi:putative bifunctional diguanylate cyclase/phosphodiesterase [Pseudosporangium ferrugineum]|uniref:Diguanylate cyclase (GGDEF)-like protein n=1 Tax=Pseudosporangium ferrugineum TaxID=439699 RepID=A0A2T0SFC0_9ACTN|nr:bifunctional diguanylate cyclase/phosphodiesterase [Pseudosporangium ferrugineum]PRY32116.1 diguanylate cyclase (GGDEF)-like protein [Pseudosporangium ferrugineum]
MRAQQRAWRWFLLGGVPVVVAGAVLGPAAQEAGYAAFGAAAGAAVIVGMRAHRPARKLPWVLLAAGMACGAVSNLAWSVALLLGRTPTGLTVVDAVYYGMYLLVAGALAVLAARGRGSALVGMAEAGIVACTAAVLAWVFLIDPFVDARDDWATGGGALAYPVLDLILLTMAVRLAVTAGSLTRTHALLLFSVAALVVADVGYFLWVASGGPWSGSGGSAAGWMVFYLLVGAAALHPSMAVGAGAAAIGRYWRSPRRMTTFYAVLVLVGPVATAYAFWRDLDRGRFDTLDIALPLTAAAATAVLLVIRLSHTSTLVNRRAADLQAALDDQAAMQQRMTHLALHDALTGLPNRLHLERLIEEAVHAGRDGCLLMVDLDGFQHVNDSFGHPTGDALLDEVARRLHAEVGNAGTLARLGGDEFALLLLERDALVAEGHAQSLLRAMRRPVEVLGHRLHVTASVGLRHLASAAGSAEVLSDADLALYAAKAAGKDRVVAYDVTLRENQLRRIAVVDRLRTAIGTDAIVVHYQPIVSLETGGFIAVEALVRWVPPGEAPIGPDDFIPAAEDSGLIVPLGEQVLRRACHDAAVWYRRYGTTLTVNVSPRQLSEADFAARVMRALHDAGLPAAALILEITEGVLVGAGAQADQTIAHLSELRRFGVKVAVDDFGTGYSSLAYLRDLPIDILKIDRSFMPDAATGDPAQQVALVRTIVDLAHTLRLTAVAEGVETDEQTTVLRTLGCDKGQGFHYGRPAPADRTAEVLAGVVTPAVPPSR